MVYINFSLHQVAPAPSSPHVGQHHSLGGDIPAAGMALRASNFAGGGADMEIGPFSVQEGEVFVVCFVK